ncbi:Ibr domain protein (macronuclear) [Tetrahymena thermophila SB210]|uniref:RBR-type E3 ubiquitin transferase n=1 Tax=Tetrahymena thermophila (strain SB210) TaxID=312017 RepID=I7M0M4_TETTS|nr:Ibr domain protein [Tetrahymena thermophila SB210]EAR89393.3 Ibr domain protein [Tetrahymena thermophila SB210]|eukprot:XP_001009638.3 Ibr domain protein [Tetrahymena thermophila SB210]
MEDQPNEEDKENQEIQFGQQSQQPVLTDKVRSLSQGNIYDKNQKSNQENITILSQSNIFERDEEEEIKQNIFYHENQDDTIFKKKWAFNQLQKMGFDENNIIFCLERTENIQNLSKFEILEIAANNIPDEMQIFEINENMQDIRNIIDKAKEIYQFGMDKLVEWYHKSNQHYIYSQNDLSSSNKRVQKFKDRRTQSSCLHNHNYENDQSIVKINLNKDLFGSSLIVSSENTQQQVLECAICCQEYTISKKRPLLNCDHQFCSDCLKQYILNKINCCQVLHILCPQEGCDQEYNEKQIGEILNDDYQKERYIKFKQRQQLQLDPDIRWCIRPGCNNAIKGQKNDPKLKCSECNMMICYFCTNQWHEGQTCEQAIDQEYNQMAKNFKVKYCPQCKTKIQKNDGCNHMTCTRCNYEFCWLCTKQYRAGHYSSLNFRGCPGLMYSHRIPPCFKLLVFMKIFFKYFGFLLLGGITLALLPLILVLLSISVPNIIYFMIKKDYYLYTNCCSEIFKVFILIIIGLCTFPINFVMAIFPGSVVLIVLCITG